MIALDENALICDLAETYQVFDYRSLPVRLVATLSSGLRENSRIRMKMRGDKIPYTDSLLALIYDALQAVFWNGEGTRPQSILGLLMGEDAPKRTEKFRTFESGTDFEEARRKLLRGE